MDDAVLSENLRQALVKRIRELEPYMQIDAVHQLVIKCGTFLEKGVDEQRVVIETSKERTSFFGLSIELRNRIYELSLIPQRGEKTGIPNRRSSESKPPIPIGYRDNWYARNRQRRQAERCSCGETVIIDAVRTTWELQPALTKVSHAIRHETLPIYYGSNEFVMDPHQAWERLLGSEIEFPWALKWLKAIGPDNIKLLKNLTLNEGGRPDLSDTRFVSAARFVALMSKHGVHVPAHIVSSYYFIPQPIVPRYRFPADDEQPADVIEIPGPVVIRQFHWSKVTSELEEKYSGFGDEPGLWNDVIGLMPRYLQDNEYDLT